MTLPDIKTILYTTSLSEHTRPVFRQAVKVAIQNQAKLVMLHVLEPIGETGEMLIRDFLSEEVLGKMHDEGIAQIKQRMRKRVATFYEDEMIELVPMLDLEIEHRVMEGRRSDVIVHEANAVNAGMIIMGSHNKLGRSSGTTRKVIKQSGRPVLVVPTEG